MKKFTVALISTIVSLHAFASGYNIIDCENADNDESLAIRQDSGGQFVGLYSAELNWSGGQTTIAYKVIPSHGEYSYVGKDLSFQLKLDAQSSRGTGTFSIHSLQIENEKIDCELK